jgi:hypothetical protein
VALLPEKGVGVVSSTAQRTFEVYRDATERRDADVVLQLFADGAVLVEYDKEHPPSRRRSSRARGRSRRCSETSTAET